MGRVHAGPVIVAVIGGSSWLAEMPLHVSDEGLVYTSEMRRLHDTQLAVAHLALMIPPPVVIGITIWRGKASG